MTEQQLREDFISLGMEVSPTNEPMTFEDIADYWISKISEHYISKERVREEAGKITTPIDGDAYDEGDLDDMVDVAESIGVNKGVKELLFALGLTDKE